MLKSLRLTSTPFVVLLALMSGSSDLDRFVVSLFLAYFNSSCAKVRNLIESAVINAAYDSSPKP